jgi:hypothetical protein
LDLHKQWLAGTINICQENFVHRAHPKYKSSVTGTGARPADEKPFFFLSKMTVSWPFFTKQRFLFDFPGRYEEKLKPTAAGGLQLRQSFRRCFEVR